MFRDLIRRTTLLQHLAMHTRARRLARAHPEGVAPPVPRRIIVEPTNACNLSCAYCGNRHMSRPRTYLDPGVYEQLLDEMVELDIPRLTLHTVGEPTLHPRIARMIEMAVERERCVMMSTNGILLEEDLAREIVRASPDLINISVDAADEDVLAKLRPGLDLDHLLENLRGLRRIRDEEGRFRDSPWGTVRLPVISITCVLTSLFTRDVERRFFDTFRDLVDDFVFHRANNHAGFADGRSSSMGGLRAALYERWRQPCPFPWDTLQLMSNGAVSVCRFDFEARITVGRYPESSIPELWRSQAIRALRRAQLAFDLSDWEQCRNCSAVIYENRAEHLAITRRILKRNGFRPRRNIWLSVDPRCTAGERSSSEIEHAAGGHGFHHGG